MILVVGTQIFKSPFSEKKKYKIKESLARRWPVGGP